MSTSAVIITRGVLLSEGIASLLKESRYKVVATAAEPSELPLGCHGKGPALAIVGIDWQVGDLDYAAESIRLLRNLMPDGRVVLVVETPDPIELQRVLTLAPDACICNLGSRDILLKVLEFAFTDECVFVFNKAIATTSKEHDEFTEPASQSDDPYQPGINGHRLSAPKGPIINGQRLSPREGQVLTSLAQGKSNKAIARLYNLSEATVKVHAKAILRKTKTQNRTQAAIWAIQHGFNRVE